MLTRVRPQQIARPLIRRPRGIAVLLAGLVILTTSSAFAQRGGAGCAGMAGMSSGSTGGAGFGAFGGPGLAGGSGLAGGFGGMQSGAANPVQMMIAAQQMQAMQSEFGFAPLFDGDEVDGDHRAELAARKALRAKEVAQRRERLADRQKKQSKRVSSRAATSASH